MVRNTVIAMSFIEESLGRESQSEMIEDQCWSQEFESENLQILVLFSIIS